MPYFGGLFSDEPLPKDGFIDLPDRYTYMYTLEFRKGAHLTTHTRHIQEQGTDAQSGVG